MAAEPTTGPTGELAAAAELAPGTVIDRYRVLRPIGHGGMGEVYLARDTELGRKVALKMIGSRVLATVTGRRRFLVEAQATARFNHPHIVTLYAAGEYQGRPYVALEYLEGQDLRERLDQSRPGQREALRIARAIADALGEAHGQGILHRDLKPSNVLIARDGRPRVLDFGLAKFVADQRTGHAGDPTAALPASEDDEEFAGTARYMAPEQWQNDDTGPGTDIWAFGLILCELLHGRHPYEGLGRTALAEAVVGPEPTPLPEATRSLPAELGELLVRCVAKDPGQRPPAVECHRVLDRVLLGTDARADETDSPFRGLLPFTEQHAGQFFGREAEIANFVERLREEPVLPVVGPSGAGKSSFVQAGVIPRLREQGAWAVLRVRPGRSPFLAVAERVLAGEHITHPSGDPSTVTGESLQAYRDLPTPVPASRRRPRTETAERLAAELAADPGRLAPILRDWAEAERSRVLLFVDQLEELYTLCDDEAERRAFLRLLCATADDREDPVRVCFTLRDDFLGRAAETPEAAAVLGRLVVLRSPGAEALREF